MSIPSALRRGRFPTIAPGAVLTRMLANPSAALAVLATLAIVTLAFALHGLGNPLETDYLATLTGARLMATPGACLYCTNDQIRVQSDLLHQPIGAPDAFFGPPALALVARVFLYMSPSVGFAVFLMITLVAVLGASKIGWRLLGGIRPTRWAAVALIGVSVMSLPAAWNYWLGQWDALLLLPAMAGAMLLARGRPFVAGMLLSVLLMKPQTVWLLPVVLAIAGQWRLVLGMLLGAGLWIGTSLLLAPAGQLALWPQYVLARGPAVSASIGFPGLISLLAGSQAGFPAAVAIGSFGSAVCLLARTRLRSNPLLALALGVVFSFASAPHIFAYDLILLSVPIIVLGMRNLETALLCGMSLSAAYLLDHYGPFSGAPAETVAVILLGALLLQDLLRSDAAARA